MSAAENKLRLFVALSVPDDVKARLAEAQAALRAMLRHARVSWTRIENAHLTLRFLGDVPETRLDSLTAALRASVASHPVLRLSADELGCFPDLRRPRVFWAGVHDLTARLTGIYRSVVAATDEFAGEPAREDFAGHVTLARIKQIDRRDAAAVAEFIQREARRNFGEWTAVHLDLMRSELEPAGSRYTCLATLPLAGLAPPAPPN